MAKEATRRRPAPPSDAACCPPPDATLDGRAVVGVQADRDLARMAKALGHPARVQIVRLLARQPSCQHGDIAAAFELAPSTISEHLKILKAAGLVRGEVEGPRSCYCLDPAGLRRAKALVGAL